MKVIQLNSTCSGSTGKIATEISKTLTENGVENYLFFSEGLPSVKNASKIGSPTISFLNKVFSHIGGGYGFTDFFNTRLLIKKIDAIKPDVVHIHNIHNHAYNLAKLFRYLNKENIKIVWTFHDCWAFTGGCTYFDYVNCNKWKTRCNKCPQLKTYSEFFDSSARNYERKKRCFRKRMTIICPSLWMKSLVESSFLKNNKIVTLNNGIDSESYSYSKEKADLFALKHNIKPTSKVILSVAYSFTARKGVNDIPKIAERMGDDCVFVLIGHFPKKIKFTDNVLCISRTENVEELIGAYSRADVLLNTTYEDNYPAVNLEAVACGLPVITYDSGGSKESMFRFGEVVERGNIAKVIDAIHRVINNGKDAYTKPDYSFFDSKRICTKILDIYNDVLSME